MMIELSPIDHAHELAQAGYRVLWIDERKTHRAVLDVLAPHAERVVRVNGRMRATFASGGQVQLTSTGPGAARVYGADAAFATGDALEKRWEDIVALLATSRLDAGLRGVGPIYRLAERVA